MPCRLLAVLLLLAAASVARADDPPDKSGYTLFNPTPGADLRAFSTDRPPKANSPYTVDAGRFQIETDLVVFGQGDSPAGPTRDWTVLDPTLKLGLTNTIDAELQLTPYESARTTQGPATGSNAGVGDTVVRLKVNVLGDDGGDAAIALLPYLKIPTAAAPLGNGKVEGGLIVPIGLGAPAGFAVTVMPEVDLLADAAGSGRHAAFDFLVNLSHPLDERWTAYGEVFTTQAARPYPAVYTFDAALTFAIGPALQLDFGGNFALNGTAPRVQLYSGLSKRF